MATNFELLKLDDPDGIRQYLGFSGWLKEGERVRTVERAGEGNMNLVVRVKTSARSVILKQSRPFVEKYPSIAAPQDRLLVEAAFYKAVSGAEAVRSRMPGLLGVDADARVALLEDLGRSADCTDAYAGAALPVEELAEWLSALHALQAPPGARVPLRNLAMRDLNHAHIFELPLTGGHGLNLDDVTPGLEAEAAGFRAEAGLVGRVEALGKLYLAEGESLLHGDYFPGSWLRTDDGVRIIDPEFGFFGPAEFDLGVFHAHLILARHDTTGLAAYRGSYDPTLTARFAGVEIMRRLLGVAQLPIERTLGEKRELLRQARALILT